MSRPSNAQSLACIFLFFLVVFVLAIISLGILCVYSATMIYYGDLSYLTMFMISSLILGLYASFITWSNFHVPASPTAIAAPYSADRQSVGLIIQHPTKSAVLLICDTRSNKWGFPKGGVEACDHDFTATAVREICEETGFILDVDYTLVGNSFKKYGNVHLMNAKAKTSELPFVSCPEQHIASVAWMTIPEIQSIPRNYSLNQWLKSGKFDR